MRKRIVYYSLLLLVVTACYNYSIKEVSNNLAVEEINKLKAKKNAHYQQGKILPGKGFFLSLSMAGISTTQIKEIGDALSEKMDFREVEPNDIFFYSIDNKTNSVDEFKIQTSFGTVYILERNGGQLNYRMEQGKESDCKLIVGTVKDDLISSLKNEKLDDKQMKQIETFLAEEGKFQTKFKSGDEYKILIKHNSKTKENEVMFVRFFGTGAGIREGFLFCKNDERKLYSSYSFTPEAGAVYSQFGNMRVSSPFGMRLHPFKGKWIMHNGVDYQLQYGSNVLCPKDGYVSFAGYNWDIGNYVVVRHDDGTQTIYGHLAKSIVSPGMSIKQGNLLGYVGSSGVSTGPHLHFAIKDNTGNYLDPENLSLTTSNTAILGKSNYSQFLVQMREIKKILWDMGGA